MLERILPDYYRRLDPQPWDISIDWLLDGLEHSLLKYIARCGKKAGIPAEQDYRKALTYLDKIIEVSSDLSSHYRYRHHYRFINGHGRKLKYLGKTIWRDQDHLHSLVDVFWAAVKPGGGTADDRVQSFKCLRNLLEERIEKCRG